MTIGLKQYIEIHLK